MTTSFMPTLQTDPALIVQASALIESRTGLAASTQFRADLQNILYNLAQGDLEHYLRELNNSHETEPVWQMLINALTIGETYFFRDTPHFRVLKNHILPGLVLQRRQNNNLNLNIWSVGCATGEEPYSIAITLHEFLPDLPKWTVRLVSTDINAYALENARRGIYRNWSFRQDDGGSYRQRYFDPVDSGAQIKPHIRDMVSFRHTNVLNGSPLPQVDIIFCRNVLIYFKTKQVEDVENLLFNALAPGGWLILGQSEAIRFNRERWVTHVFPGAAAYQKPVQLPVLPAGQFAYQQHSQPALEITETKEIPAVVIPTYLDAVRALREDHPEEAERLLAEVIASQPDHAPAHLLLASIFANRRALLEAHTRVDTALKIDPLLANAHYLRAMLRLEAGARADALKSLNAALYCQREHPLASFMLGNLYAQEGDLTRAQRLWNNARRAIDNFDPAIFLSDLSDMTAGNLKALVDSQLDGWES